MGFKYDLMGGLGYYNESLPITGVRHQHNTLISDS